jgi:hypothetical protein
MSNHFKDKGKFAKDNFVNRFTKVLENIRATFIMKREMDKALLFTMMEAII